MLSHNNVTDRAKLWEGRCKLHGAWFKVNMGNNKVYVRV